MNVFYKTRKKGIDIVFSPKFHQHSHITEEVLLQLLGESEKEIEEGYTFGECVLSKDCHAVMGVTHCIKCEKSPNIYFKRRGDRPYLSRMIRGALPVETNYVTIVLRVSGHLVMTIITAWVGVKAEPELGDISYFERQENPQEAIVASANFWTKHALIEENPTAEELYLDLEILAKRLNTTIWELSDEQLLMILNARISSHLQKSISCRSRDKDSMLQWLNSEVVSTYLNSPASELGVKKGKS